MGVLTAPPLIPLAEAQEAYGLACLIAAAAYEAVAAPERERYEKEIRLARQAKTAIPRPVIARWTRAQLAAAEQWHAVIDGPMADVDAALAARAGKVTR